MRSYSILSLVLGLALGGCMGPDAEWDVSTNHDTVQPSITWEQFRSSVDREPWEGGAFIVDGDIRLFGEEALSEFYNTWIDQAAGKLTVGHVMGADVIWPSSQRFMLTYCISNNFGTRKPEIVTAMQQATASWSDVIAVGFEYRSGEDSNCTNNNNNVLFNVRLVNATYFASAFFPDSTRAARELLVTESAFTTNAGGRDLQGILRHEVGHVLGFRHEHIHITCTDEGPAEGRQVTSYDVNSVMHYPQCRPSGTGGYRQTALDFKGAITLYGATDPSLAWMVPVIDLILQ
jgi:serralysin